MTVVCIIISCEQKTRDAKLKTRTLTEMAEETDDTGHQTLLEVCNQGADNFFYCAFVVLKHSS